MEAGKFKLQYFSHKARYFHSVKSVETPAIGTFIPTLHTKMTPNPPPISLIIGFGEDVQTPIFDT